MKTKTLREIVMEPLIYQQNKHDLGDGWAENYVRKMDNMEFLELLSDALEQWEMTE